MIDTFFSLDALGSPIALFISLLIGLGFGLSLEQAGFGSSRRLAGIFYFRDMTVLKVMFTAVLTAMLGLSWLLAAGLIKLDSINLLETIYGAQIIGGLLLGIGFVMGGWCPGTAAVGLASGSLDALLFLFGAMGGAVIFNEWYPRLAEYVNWGNQGVLFVYDTLGTTRPVFALAFTAVGVAAFWGSEFLEEYVGTGNLRRHAPVLVVVSIGLLLSAGGLFVTPASPTPGSGHVASFAQVRPGSASISSSDQALLETIETAADHIEPEELADRLMAGDAGLYLVDVRSPAEYAAYHLPGAVNLSLPDLPTALAARRNQGTIVLYSNGMTHPAQARDVLQRQGYQNVYLLTEGLVGFLDRCLKPASVRATVLSDAELKRINAWRSFFLQAAPLPAAASQRGREPDRPSSEGQAVIWPSAVKPEVALPGLVSTAWLADNLGKPGVKVLDLRPQPEYNRGHLPGAVSLQVESLRGMSAGVPSMLLPSSMIVQHFSQLGLRADDIVILIHGEKLHDATLVGMAFDRIQHRYWGILDGGHALWLAEKRPLTRDLPQVQPVSRPPVEESDRFTVTSEQVLRSVRQQDSVIVDVRPVVNFLGTESDEARAGHIPGAVNRPYTEEVVTSSDGVVRFRSRQDLASAWSALGVRPRSENPSPNDGRSTEKPVIVHCRTGHQASQAYFLLNYILGFRDILWYDGGWTEWASRPDLPLATGTPSESGN
ncbi:MAG TPA: rhodanese-like domain-containing protein [Candidatus Ozemobacteraceae bacterium]|nr:rhodanese-like domain-containing protein [Candidatus Ozemobacteraceae bacterium]